MAKYCELPFIKYLLCAGYYVRLHILYLLQSLQLFVVGNIISRLQMRKLSLV